MAIQSIKRLSKLSKQREDKAERGITSSARAKARPSGQQFGGVATRMDNNARTLSKRAKRAAVHEYKGPRRRPIQ